MERAGTRPAALRNRPPARPCCCIPAFLEAPALHNADHRPSHSRVLALGFSAHAALSDTESDLLRDLAGKTRYHPPYRDLHAAEAAPPPPRMIVAGWAAQYRHLASGQRQIVSLRLPGDFVAPWRPLRLPSSCAVAALTELETVNAQLLADAGPAHPGLAHAVHVMAHLETALLDDQIVRLGRQTAGGRFAHLMLELHERLGRVGLAEDDRFAMPLTQEVLADVLGFSVVHVNRTIQQLRRDRLLDVRNGMVVLMQPERLQELASWTPPAGLTALPCHGSAASAPRRAELALLPPVLAGPELRAG
jgi:CRP-like cAMP-binding protein